MEYIFFSVQKSRHLSLIRTLLTSNFGWKCFDMKKRKIGWWMWWWGYLYIQDNAARHNGGPPKLLGAILP